MAYTYGNTQNAGQVAEHFPHFIHFRGFTPEISLILSAAFSVFPYV